MRKITIVIVGLMLITIFSYISPINITVAEPPNVPNNPNPPDGSSDVSIEEDLNWTGGDPDPGDKVVYDVYFGTSDPLDKVVSNEPDLNYDPGTLAFSTQYFWKIVAWDNHNESSVGPLWSFTTQPESGYTLTLTTSGTGSGTIQASPAGPYTYGTVVTIWANASTGSTFTGFSGDLTGTTTPQTLVMDSNSTVNAQFTLNGPYTLNLMTSGTGSGTIQANASGPFYYGDVVRIWANASISSTFSGFTGALTGKTSPQFLVMNGNKSVTAIFTISGGGGGGGPQNIKPFADASAREPYQGFINFPITFDGSKSDDIDGSITTWFWVFGDNNNGYGKIVEHTYTKPGTYTVILTVTDNDGATNTDTTTCLILETSNESNRPPFKPIITGPISGTKNTLYTYTAFSTDPDNDSIQYTFNWGDLISTLQSSTFLSNGSNFTVNHGWAAAGRYNVTVTVTDNQTESSHTIFVYIDAVQTRGAGYLLDNDGDGVYDAFHSDETNQTRTIQFKGDSYFIDKNGDGEIDYVYNATSGLTSYQEPRKTPGFELVFIFVALMILTILWKKKRKKK